MSSRSQVYAVAWGGVQDPDSAIKVGEPTIRLSSSRVASPEEACRQAFGMVSADMTAMPLGGNMGTIRTAKFRNPRIDELQRRHVALQSKHAFVPMSKTCLCIQFEGPILSGWQGKKEVVDAQRS
jgi:hypothetical protein